MNRLRIGLMTAVALAAALPSIANAQGRGRNPQEPDAGPLENNSRWDRGGPDRGRQDVDRGDRGDRRANNDDRRFEPRRDNTRPGFDPNADRRGPNPAFANNDRRAPYPGAVNGDRRWNAPGPQGRVGPDWRNDRRYDWRGYRQTNRQAFRAGRYVAPRGWGYGYRRVSVGFRLDPFFYASNYWISDPFAYRLPPVWGSYRWVRYYDDVLLIDLASGQVVDAIPDFFW